MASSQLLSKDRHKPGTVLYCRGTCTAPTPLGKGKQVHRRRGALRLPRRARASSACGAQGFPAAESAERGVSLAPCVGCVGSGQVWRSRGGYPARAARRAIPGESAPRDPRLQATRAARPGSDIYQKPGPYNCMDVYFESIFNCNMSEYIH